MSLHLGDTWQTVVRVVGLLAATALVLTLVVREAVLLGERSRDAGVRALVLGRVATRTWLGLFLAAGVLQVLMLL